MAGADYAHCDSRPCLKPDGTTKVIYLGDQDVPFGAVIRHGECDDMQLAAAETRGRQLERAYLHAAFNRMTPEAFADLLDETTTPLPQTAAPDLDLDPIRERRAAAKRWHYGVYYGLTLYAASSDDVPALIAEVERLRHHTQENPA